MSVQPALPHTASAPTLPTSTAPERNSGPLCLQEHIIKGQRFMLPSRYTPGAKLGSGSYGIVIAARDNLSSDKIAIKRCGNVFKHCEDGKRVLREIKMMSMLDHRNILSIKDVFVSNPHFEDVYIVTPCLDTDLAQLLKSHVLTEKHIKYIMYQILRALKYVHSANILHRDLKPANVLINYDCHVKLCDFGLARGYDKTEKQNMTSYIVTRWYRAPELLLNNTDYNGSIDIWAAGCILAELILGKPLFPGESSQQQLDLICSTVAVPEWEDLWWVQSAKSRDQLAAKAGVPPPRDFKKMIQAKGAKPIVLDLLEKMLAFNPNQRWDAETLLGHPYFQEVRSNRHLAPSDYRFKWKYDAVTNLKEDKLRQLYWQELVQFHAECAPPGTRAASPVRFEPKPLGAARQNTRDEASTISTNAPPKIQGSSLSQSKPSTTAAIDSKAMTKGSL